MIPRLAAPYWTPALANEEEKTGKRLQLNVGYFYSYKCSSEDK